MERRLRWLGATLLATLAVLAALAPGVPADGDPASDVLIPENVYLPYKPKVSPAVGGALRAATANAKAAGYPIKVALINNSYDLGAVPNMFGRPQRYARFLESEIAFNKPVPLLVVMPAGFGLSHAGPKAPAAVAGLSVPKGQGPDGLGRAALTAVGRLSQAAGHPIVIPRVRPAKQTRSGASPLLIIGVPLALLIVGGLIGGIRRSRRPSSGP